MHPSSESRPVPCACTALRKASRAVSRVYDAALAPSGLTTTQLAILRTIARRGGVMPLPQLAEALVMDRTSLYRALAPLARQGMLTLAAAPRGRAKQAALTPAGRAAMDAAAPLWDEAQARIVGAMGAEAWTRIETGLRGLVALATCPPATVRDGRKET